MNKIALRLGPLRIDGHQMVRSDIRWLCQDGQVCRPNQVIAYCNVGLVRSAGWSGAANPFQDEHTTQIGLAPRIGGRITIDSAAARGGYLNITALLPWADDVVGHLQPTTPVPEAEAADADAGSLRLLMLTGRRMTALADVHAGLLPGWNGRTRGWWCGPEETPLTLLSLGICDATGVVIGEQCAFLDLFEATQQPSHVVFVPDQPVTPAAPVLLDALARTPAQLQAIATDIQGFLAASATAPTGDDLMFAGSMLAVLGRSPIADRYAAFSASGSMQLGPPAATLVSLIAEPPVLLRHKRLGFRVHVMRHHHRAAGPVMREWLAQSFEPVRRSADDLRHDYRALIDAVAAATGGRLLILNRMSTSGFEDISSYQPFDAPMSDTLATVAAKEQNLMLHDLAQEREVYVIDIDALAAGVGAAEHLPDGTHQSALLQHLVRREILEVLDHLRP